jgi:hypothetical protein
MLFYKTISASPKIKEWMLGTWVFGRRKEFGINAHE